MKDFLDDFPRDTEFRKLLARHEEVNLTDAALELARDAEPALDFSPVHRWIDERASELSGPLARAGSDAEIVGEIGKCLAGRHGINGSREIYGLAEGSFLHCIIESRTGIPISLSVLYMAVAERAGFTLRGVSAPGHFLTRYEAFDHPLFVDAFDSGRVIPYRQCISEVQSRTGLAPDAVRSSLEAVGHRAIIIRMLNNLKVLYAKQDKWRLAFGVQHRLLALQPASYNERRDWGLISLKAGLSSQALEMLESCLGNAPKDEREVLKQHLAEAKKQVAQWN